MGIFDWLNSPSAESRLLDELAVLVGINHALAGRLKRHAAMCKYSNLKAGVEEVAAKEAAHTKALNAILRERDIWSRPPASDGREGANNWERLSGDLATLSELQAQLHRQSVKWEALNRDLSRRILAVAIEDDSTLAELRALAAKCDPQAFD